MLAVFLNSLRRAAAHPKWVGLLTLVNLGFAALAATPVYLFMRQVDGRSLVADRLRLPGLDFDWFTAAFRTGGSGNFPLRFLAVFLLVGATYLIINIYLTGGAAGLFTKRTKGFIADCREHFLPLLGAAILAGFGYLAIFIATVIFMALGERQSARAVTESSLGWIDWATLLFFLIGFGLVGWVFDFVKVGMVAHGARNPFRQLGITLALIARNPARTLGPYLLTYGAWALIVGSLTFAALALPQTSWPTIAVGFALQQVAFFARNWLRLAFYAGVGETCERFAPTSASPTETDQWLADFPASPSSGASA
jgi:hypothetical protein